MADYEKRYMLRNTHAALGVLHSTAGDAKRSNSDDYLTYRRSDVARLVQAE
jgi:hypothetical protein